MSDEEKEKKERLAESKLILLYLLSKANCTLTNSQILKLLYDFEGFNYYYFQNLLSDLVNQKYILNYQQDDEWLYKIAPEGQNLLDLTGDLLPGIVKHKLDIITKEQLQNVQEEVAITAEYLPLNGNNYTTSLKISESHQTLFELNVFCATQEQAKKIADNWKANANDYYPEIIKMLTK